MRLDRGATHIDLAQEVFGLLFTARLEASFLIERDKWTVFHEALGEERQRLPELEIDESGPLPPYDFVRLQFGA